MYIFTNGFWDGFINKTDGVHVGAFEYIIRAIVKCPVEVIVDKKYEECADYADILLESHFMKRSYIHEKKWRLTIFFSGEVVHPYPAHHKEYDIVLGTNENERNRVACPLYAFYQFCKPEYISQTRNHNVPPKGDLCAVIRQCHPNCFREFFIDCLIRRGLSIDMGGLYRNNTGGIVPGAYYEQPLQDYQAQYKCILALENSVDEWYISEKIVNPIYAGVVPIYFGSPRIGEFINLDRIICVREDNYMDAIAEIEAILNDDDVWLRKVNGNGQPAFIRSYIDIIDEAIAKCCDILHKTNEGSKS